jgi:hypothetical protein
MRHDPRGGSTKCRCQRKSDCLTYIVRSAQFVIGHSVGENAACYFTETIVERKAILLAYKRATCVRDGRARPLNRRDGEGHSREWYDRTDTVIACYNSAGLHGALGGVKGPTQGRRGKAMA